ncbi:MAG: hypothetical protein ABF242_07440 [Flavobacteriales bacterium]
MFSFLKNKKVNIDSINFPTFDWEISKEDEFFKQWMNKEQNVALSINFFDSKPDLPYLNEIDVVREFYRKELSSHNGGLIEVNLKEIENYTTIKTVFKISQEPAGISYLASLTFPFKHYSFVIKIQAVEIGMSGSREAETRSYLLKNKELNQVGDTYPGWEQDPYNKEFSKGLLMNLSEAKKYDSVYANHALSKARTMLKTIESNLQFDEELTKLKKLKK